MKLLTYVLVAILILAFPILAADHYNSGTLTKSETATQVTYKWTLTIADGGDSIGSWHSRPMFIADCNVADGYTRAVGTAGAGTEDVNLLWHFSLDEAKDTWVSTTPADYDALGGTAVEDTIGYEAGADDITFSLGNFFVVEYDGQASNVSNRLFTFVVSFTKDILGSTNAARIATGSGTNP